MTSLPLRCACLAVLFACGSASDAPDQGTETPYTPGQCDPSLSDFVPLFDGSDTPTPAVTVRDDGVIVTRAAGRVRGRHELEGGFSTYGGRYFENRTFGVIIEDYVLTGDPRVVVHYLPEARVSQNGPGTNFRVWKVYGNGNLFHNNGGMDEIDPRHLVATVTDNRREGGPVAAGQIMDFEFGIFIAGFVNGDPEPIEGRTSYYSDTFRYRVGVGGLIPESQDPSGVIGPAQSDWLAGDATIPYVYAEPEMAFSQLALNTQPDNIQDFLQGRRVFHTSFDDGSHSESGNPDLTGAAGLAGPLSNVASCVSCHVRNGRGEVEPPGSELRTSVIKLYGSDTYGSQLQPQEASVHRVAWSEVPVTLADGSVVSLRAPEYDGLDPDLQWSIRRPRQIAGLGLLEAIDEQDLLAVAVADGCQDGAQISGRASVVTNPETGDLQLGRFGWKAEKISLRHQIADALIEDMGVTSPVFDAGADPELDEDAMEDLTTYMRLLSLPGRQDSEDPQIIAGEGHFARSGCTACHTPEHTTGSTHPFAELREQTIQPYTDLLLHDMGPGLADGSGGPLASEWRTPPLWGLGTLVDVDDDLHLLHDGRARGVAEAVLWHQGEAQRARDAFAQLSAQDRDALVAFVMSL